MECAKLNDILLHFEDRGAADLPAVVFSNSLGTDFRIWEAVAAKLGAGFRVLLYDKRGHGLSDVGVSPYRMEDHVADLEALLDARRIQQAILCGISVGGQIALGLAAKRPDLVRRLILCDTGHRIGTAESWNARIDAIERGGLAAIADAVLERWFAPVYRRSNPAAMALWRNMLTRTPAAGYAGTCVALREADLTSAARSLGMPTLCLGGEADLSTPPELMQAMAALIPGAAFRPIPDAGHLPCIEQPALVADHILAFAKETAFA